MHKNSEVVKTKNKKGGCLKVAIIVLLVCVMLCGSVLIYNRCTKEERELKYAKANILQSTEIKIPDEAALLFYYSQSWFAPGRTAKFAVFEFRQEPTDWLKENKFLISNDETNKLFKILSKVGMTESVRSMPYKEKTCLFKNYEKDGIEISGGEAQKVSLARALYKDSPLMVLDEPTAALDTKAEQLIYKQFSALTLNKTVLYISHRLSSCYFCNKIMVFDKGTVIQFGSHEELLKDTNGKYYKLWSTQAQYYVNKDIL